MESNESRAHAVPLETVFLDGDGLHLLLEAALPDGSLATLVLDTGASKSVFDISLMEGHYEAVDDAPAIQSAGISADMLENRFGLLRRLRLGGLEIEDLEIVLLDLGHVNRLYAQFSGRQVWGLLGSDLLERYGATIDYRSRLLTLRSPGAPAAAAAAEEEEG